MKWPVPVQFRSFSASNPRSPSAYTLVEILVATCLSLILLGAVVRMFGDVGQSITDSRAMLESADRLRMAATRLQMDLAGVTVTMNPPRKSENNEGYFEYVEGPVGPVTAVGTPAAAINSDVSASTPDTTVGDYDDILMFTTRSTGRPFVGRYGAGTIQSDVAEVAWFVRGRTLHRRVLLVVPGLNLSSVASAGYYGNCDVSARLQGTLVANTLGDLTRRENRFAHDTTTFPFSISNWGQAGLPTLWECSDPAWTVNKPPVAPTLISPVDFWTNAASARQSDAVLATGGTRVADDIILTNVIGFDVKAFDPANGYVDLGNGIPGSRFTSPTCTVATTGATLTRTYDTWSTHYEYVPVSGLGGVTPGQAANGFADNGGIVDGAADLLTSPPYPYPLRGIQVKIRAFEPDSRQVREVTVVQDFLPQ